MIRVALILFLFPLIASAAPSESFKRVEESEFGKIPDGSAVHLYTLRNAKGMTAKIINYGAILTELQVPDRNGVFTNVVLGTNNLERYLKGFRAPAAIIGRVANRIAKAKFTLDGVEYKLPANNGPNHLHGTFDKVLWSASELLPDDGASSGVTLRYVAKSGEEGYPGNVTVSVAYMLTDNNELRIEYQAITDKPTPVNLTSHAYFNLAGYGDVLNHELLLGAARYTPADDQLIPTGELAPVKGTPLDFTTPRRIGAQIGGVTKTGGYDHNFVLDGFSEKPDPGQASATTFATGVFLKPQDHKSLLLAARVYEPSTGRVMEVRTTEPGVQVYTGNHLQHGALCLETQHFPDSVNHPSFPSTILRPGQTFKSMTVFAFSIK